MKSTRQPRRLQGDRISIQPIEAEILVYDESTHRAWCLNPSSGCIWQLCDGRRTIAEIAAAARPALGPGVDEALVQLTLDELDDQGLLEPDTAPRDASRRQVMGRIGLAAAGLLPVVAAITAPPALAQSGSTGTGDAAALAKKKKALAARSSGINSAPAKPDEPTDPYTQ
jgi:hypothetical protein